MTMRRAITAAAAAAALGAGCGAKDPAPPSAGTYAVSFPSTAAAVAAETVQVQVFDVGDAGAADVCPELVIARRTNLLPPPLAESKPVSPCDMSAGQGQVTVPFGTRAVLAVATRQGQDFLIGCAVQNVGEGSTVPVQLALASTSIAVPATQCAKLSDKCAGGCQ